MPGGPFPCVRQGIGVAYGPVESKRYSVKIGIDIRATQFLSGQRGIGKYIHSLVEGLCRMAPQNEYVLITVDDLKLPEMFQPVPAACRIASVRTRRLRQLHRFVDRPTLVRAYCSLVWWEQMRSLQRLVRRERFDVIHLACPVDPFHFSDGDFGCRTVKTLYDLTPLAMLGEFIERWNYQERYVYETQLASYRRADVVVAISESARQDAITLLGLLPDRVRAVSCAVSEAFAPLADNERLEACRERYHIGRPFFLFCSGSGPNKNQERVVEAFAAFAGEHPDPFQLVLAGPKSQSERNRVEQQVKALGVGREKIVVTGWVGEDDLVTLFAGATALVTPSLYEGFGLPAAQAMRAGTPVIASNRSSLPEVVGDAGLLVDPYSTDAITGAMLCLARDANLREELSRRGRIRARRFEWQNQAKAMIELYHGTTKVKSRR